MTPRSFRCALLCVPILSLCLLLFALPGRAASSNEAIRQQQILQQPEEQRRQELELRHGIVGSRQRCLTAFAPTIDRGHHAHPSFCFANSPRWGLRCPSWSFCSPVAFFVTPLPEGKSWSTGNAARSAHGMTAASSPSVTVILRLENAR